VRASARDLSLGGLFGALGVVVPVVFHAVGLGPAFLPMHMPVLICGLLVAEPVALTVGLVVPLMSSALTGMPPPVPVALLMAPELAALAVTAAVLRRRLRLPVVIAVLGAIAAARLVGVVERSVAAPWLGVDQARGAYLLWTIVTSWPGMLVQVVAAPPVVRLIDGGPWRGGKR
jgi:hypothetical protein